MDAKKYREKKKYYWAIQIMSAVLFLTVIYNDMNGNITRYLGSFLPFEIITDKTINYLLKIAGAYGLIQIFAQDLGLQTGNLQIRITHQPIVQFILLFSTGYSLTNDRSESFIATMLYFYLRNILSNEFVRSN